MGEVRVDEEDGPMLETVVLGALLSAASAALADAAQPDTIGRLTPRTLEVKEEDGVRYVSGGIGESEEQALREMGEGFNLQVTLADPAGHYLGSAHLVIEDYAGRTVLETATDGPLLFAELPPGRYTVRATESGRTPARKSVQVSRGSQRDVLLHLEKTGAAAGVGAEPAERERTPSGGSR
jgi:hypothetical protein